MFLLTDKNPVVFVFREITMSAAKRSPAKYQPKGLTVIYEDKEIIVVDGGFLASGVNQ